MLTRFVCFFIFTTLSTSKALKEKMEGFYYLNVLISSLVLEILIFNFFICVTITTAILFT